MVIPVVNRIKEFEALCYAAIRKEFPYHEEWLLAHRKIVGSVCGTISWVIQRKNKRILAFCEVSKKLAKERLENIALCKDSYGAEKVIVFIPTCTEISQELLDFAERKGIEIKRINWE